MSIYEWASRNAPVRRVARVLTMCRCRTQVCLPRHVFSLRLPFATTPRNCAKAAAPYAAFPLSTALPLFDRQRSVLVPSKDMAGPQVDEPEPAFLFWLSKRIWSPCFQR